MRAIVLALTVLLSPSFAAGKRKKVVEKKKAVVECTDPVTGEQETVRVPAVRSGLERARRALKKNGVHILDLPREVQERHSYLPQLIVDKNWCVLNQHVIAIENAIGMTRIDQRFIEDKFERVERWMRTGIEDATEKAEAERRLANVAANMADQRFEDANRLLNEVIGAIFGSADTWKMPAKLPEADEATDSRLSAPPIQTREVEAGCPALAKRGRATAGELDASLARLRRLMDDRAIRPLDLKGGEQLVTDLDNYRKLSATWPAARIVCALIERTQSLEIGLGVVQKRFQRARNLKEQRGLPSDAGERFKELVRSASRKMMAREFEPAHRDLEALLVLVGEPGKPSAAIP